MYRFHGLYEFDCLGLEAGAGHESTNGYLNTAIFSTPSIDGEDKSMWRTRRVEGEKWITLTNFLYLILPSPSMSASRIISSTSSSVNFSPADIVIPVRKDLRKRKKPTEIGHDMPQFGCADVIVSVLIKNLEGLPDILLTVTCVAHLPGHHGQELGEIDGPVSIGVDLIDHPHVSEFGFCGVLTQGTQDSAKLLCGDRPGPIYYREVRYRLRVIEGT